MVIGMLLGTVLSLTVEFIIFITYCLRVLMQVNQLYINFLQILELIGWGAWRSNNLD